MTPLVLVHGFMGGSAQWRLQQHDLGCYHDLISIDLPGFGENNHMKAPDTIEGFARFVLDHLTKTGVDRFNLIGHSMGGMIVQEMVALASNRVEQLVLYGTAATGDLPGRFETFEESRRRVEEDGVEASARRISSTWFLAYDDAAEFNNCALIAEQSSLQAMLAALEAMEKWSRADKLSQITCPVMIVWGEHDRTYRWPQIEELWSKIPDASLAVIPGCSHAAHMEKPKIFNTLVEEFLG